MLIRLFVFMWLCLCSLGASAARVADCGAADTLAGVRRAYALAQSLERADRSAEALAACLRAQHVACDPNPVAAAVARRAAARPASGLERHDLGPGSLELDHIAPGLA